MNILAVLTSILIFAFSFLPSQVYAAVDTYYVTQNGQGSRSGKSLPNAWSVLDFNNSVNWSATDDSDKIDPGDTVCFSGKITSTIDIKGSGSSGKYITFDGKDAQIDVDVSSIGARGVIYAVNQNYLEFKNFTIDGQMTIGEVSRGGICIKSKAGSSDYIIIDNCEISRTVSGIWLCGNVGHITIKNCYLHHLSGSGLWSVVLPGEADAPHYVTFGGSPGNGNTVKNVGYLDSDLNVDSDIYIDQGDDIIISYNHLFSDSPDYGFSGMYLNECRKVLVEYNTIHDHDVDHHRNAITFKDDQLPRKTGYAIVRYNHLFNSRSSIRSWGSGNSAIGVGYNAEHFYVYGNYIRNSGVGIRLNIGWASPYYKDGIDCEHLYVFSNIIDTTQQAGIRIEGPVSSSYDSLSHVYIFNNTIYRPATFDYDQNYIYSGDTVAYSDDSGIHSSLDDSQTINLHIINNVIIDSRPNKSDYIQISLRRQSDLILDYQHYYHSSGMPVVNGKNDTIGNPLLTDASSGDFTISSSNSPIINSGKKMGDGNIKLISIQGNSYVVEWDTALDPQTDWTRIPPKIITAKQNQHGPNWEKGAYVFVESTTNSSIKCPTSLRITNVTP